MKSRQALQQTLRRPQGKAPRLAVLTLALQAASLGFAQSGSGGPQLFGSAEHWKLIEGYCIDCHNLEDWSGQLAFDLLDLQRAETDGAMWEKVIRKLRSGMMPPPGAARPPVEDVHNMVAWLEDKLDDVEHSSVGHVPLHRLNRGEYANAVYDLLGLRVDPASLLPVDGEEEGFDNIASALKVSPAFVDQYITAARTLSELAVGSPTAKPQSVVLNFSPSGQEGHVDGMPFGTRGGIAVEHHFPVDGEYTLNIGRLISTNSADLQHRHTVIALLDGRRFFEMDIGGEATLKEVDQQQAPAVDRLAAQLRNISFTTTAGPHTLTVTFVNRSHALSDETLKPLTPFKGQDMPVITQLDIFGPTRADGLSATPSRERIFHCYPRLGDEIAELDCARAILERLGERAFRGRLTSSDTEGLLALYEYGRRFGGFEEGVKHSLAGILAHPKFLYRMEPPPADTLPGGSVYALSSLDLAARLSFFLWGTLPDDDLLAAARHDGLRNPDVLEDQVRRMLQDPRAETLANSFATQWLRLGTLENLTPDPALYADVERGVRDTMLEEVRLFVDSVFREDHSIMALLDAPWTFLNESLARHYGIAGIQGDQFRRVELEDPIRHGLLGKGAILMVSSYPNRTSPVLRGAWVLENLMGTPPPAPPANVEGLQENVAGQAASTVRERLEAHRANPACNNCHGVIDPLGFALENFDVTGRFRLVDREAGTAIDASGVLPDGTPLDGPAALQKALLAKPEHFAQTLTEKLMTFALGRVLEWEDMPAVRTIVRQAAEEDYRFSALVLGIVQSPQFQMNAMASSTIRARAALPVGQD